MITYDFAPQVSLLLLLNAVINVGIAAVSIHRLRLMAKVLWRVKIQYVLLCVVSVAAAMSPMLFRTWPTFVSVSLSAVMLYVLVSDAFQWSKGHAPNAALSHPVPLAEEKYAD